MKHWYQPKESPNPGYVPPHQGSKILHPFSGYCHDCAKWGKGEDGEFRCWAQGGVVERTPGGLLFALAWKLTKIGRRLNQRRRLAGEMADCWQ